MKQRILVSYQKLGSLKEECWDDSLMQSSDQQIWSQVFSPPPSALPAVFVQLVTVSWSLTLRRLWGTAGRRPEVTLLSRTDLSAATALFFFFLVPLPKSNFSASFFLFLFLFFPFFVWQLYFRKEGCPGDVSADMNGIFIQLQCFLWSKQLVFVVKRPIRKKTPLSWLSRALLKRSTAAKLW